MILLRICLPSTYPIFSSDISVGSRCLSLLEITLEMILYTTLHKAMGLNLFGVTAFFCLGIKAMKDSLRALGTVLEFLNSSTIARMSCLTISQHVLKKVILKSSQTRAFPLCISLISSLTSSSVTHLLRF